MKRIPSIAAIVSLPAVLVATAFAEQDRYSLEVPGGLAFADFRGYEDWQTVVRQSQRRQARVHPRQSRNDRGLQVGHPGQRQAFPRWREVREDPLDREEG